MTLTRTLRHLPRLAWLALAAWPLGLAADIRLPTVLGDGMVLQRDAEVTLWGWADDGEVVSISLDGEPWAQATAANGQWRVKAPARPAGGPHKLTFSGNNTIEREDAWFGDVWIASGQSNMEYPLSRLVDVYAEDIAAASLPLIRQFKVPKTWDFQGPRDDIDGAAWVAASPDTVADFSAVAFFFARDIHARYDVPIGIVNTTFGGSPAEGWLNEADLARWPHYLAQAQAYQDADALQALREQDRARNDAWYTALDAADRGLSATPPWSDPAVEDSDWEAMTVPGDWGDSSTGPVNGAVWLRRHIDLPAASAGQPALLRLGRIVDADTAWVNGVAVGQTTYQYPQRRYEVPAGVLREGENVITIRIINSAGRGEFVADKPYRLEVAGQAIDLSGDWKLRLGAAAEPLAGPAFQEWSLPLAYYNAMLAPLTPLTLKGVTWYQGESNVKDPAEYAELFPFMITAWRRYFGQPDLPFLFVQLANFLPPADEPGDSDWAETRDAQAGALALPRTGMAVAIDVGEWNDIHPVNKRTVGERLALQARKIAYGEDSLLASGPTLGNISARGHELVLTFANVSGGLYADLDRGNDGTTADRISTTPGGFQLAGPEGPFHWADARIEGNAVIVSSAAVEQPARVRYAWADNPVRANLYNTEGLPAAPFQASVQP
ncbi:sialate O-acetylesterase [Marinihelvus fidelis]|uniref:Sialate O-acetylesterase n=1 Tax=Marinihelvus fidelis TaxID=2613842 RepID=A0A5N0TDV7_9GAMM|nr:sialate O-acetylesterase [Marinihelvus fidelis]KAA9132644.1 sialate O-acetylesterase [Marinihelvus fidelis]